LKISHDVEALLQTAKALRLGPHMLRHVKALLNKDAKLVGENWECLPLWSGDAKEREQDMIALR